MKEKPLAFPRCLVLWILCFWTNQSQMGCGPKPPGCGLALGKKKLVSNSPWRDNDLELPTYGDHPALSTTAIAASCGSFERPLCAKYKRFKKERKLVLARRIENSRDCCSASNISCLCVRIVLCKDLQREVIKCALSVLACFY